MVFRAVRRTKRRATMAEAIEGDVWVTHIVGPSSMQMLVEIAHICDLLDMVQLSEEPDTFSWSLTVDGQYSSASAYGAMFFGSS